MTPAVTPQPDQQQAQPQTLAQRVRAKYPGEYDDMDDQTLESKVLAKYPEYSDLPRTPYPTPTATIGPARTGVLPWLQNVESDIRTGTASTGPGKFLRFLGAPGIESGTTPATATQIAGPLIGPVTAAQGVAEKSPLKFIQGALQTASPALAFSAPESAEAAAAVPGKIASAIPSKARAAELFSQAMGKAGESPVAMSNELSQALSRYQELVDAGGSQSQVIGKLMRRVTNPDMGPLSYKEARDFSSNIGRLSSAELTRLSPVMRSQVGQIYQALKNTVQETANQAGAGQEYSTAMRNFAQRSQLNDMAAKAGKYAMGQLAEKLPWLAAVYAGKKIITPGK